MEKDIWSGFTTLMAELIEKYACKFDLDNLDVEELEKRNHNPELEKYIIDK